MESGGNQLFVRFSGGVNSFQLDFSVVGHTYLPSRPPVPAFEGGVSERER